MYEKMKKGPNNVNSKSFSGSKKYMTFGSVLTFNSFEPNLPEGIGPIHKGPQQRQHPKHGSLT